MTARWYGRVQLALKSARPRKKQSDGTEPALKDCWDEYDDPDERFQIVTARGKIFTLEESGGGNSTTTIIIDNSTHTVINNTLTGGGVGFGFLPQIEVYEPPIKMVAWGNSTHTDAASVVLFARAGEVDYTSMVRATDEPISFTLPPFSGEYRLFGGKMVGTNDLSGPNSDWEDKGGWWEMSGGKNGTEPYTSVVRLDNYPLDKILNITAYASENATIRIVSSPNDLASLVPAGDGFAPEVVLIDSYLNYTKVLVNSYSHSSSNARNTPITHDLFECVEYSPGRGYKCHEFAYPSYPAETRTDFYVKNCYDVVETRRAGSVDVLDGVTAGYTKGVYNSTGTYSADFEQWRSVTLNTPPVIECGPKIDSYHHVTKIEQNQTASYRDTYLFGPDQGTLSSGDLLTEIHGNMTLNAGSHTVRLDGIGLFEEAVDLRKTTSMVSEVTVDVESSFHSLFGYLVLEAPDGQQVELCRVFCSQYTYFLDYYADERRLSIPASFNSTNTAGDWKLHGKEYAGSSSHLILNSWTLKFDSDGGITNMFSSPYSLQNLSPNYYGHIDTIAVPHGPQSRYNGDLYLMAIGVNATETVMVRATDYVSPSLLSISNLPSYVPYEITYGNYTLKAGMTDGSGRMGVQYSEVGIELTEPVIFKYWPNSLTYVGNHHAAGKSIMFDTYHDMVIPFPWDPADPLMYVAKAYVLMTIPVDDMSLDGIRLYNKAGQHVSYPHLTGTYDSGDEVFVPIFLGTTEIHLKINGDWVQSYVKDVQQNTRARVLGGPGSISGVDLSETATIFVTKPGDVLAFVTATVTGSSHTYFSADYSSNSQDRYDSAIAYAIYRHLPYSTQSDASSVCSAWRGYVYSASISNLRTTIAEAFNNATSGGAISVSAYRNGVLVANSSSIVSDEDVGRSYSGDICFVVTYRDGTVRPHSTSNPWRIGYSLNLDFDNEQFQKYVRVSGLEAGDQLDFVVHSVSNFEMQNPSSITPRSLPFDRSGEFIIQNGYIIIYQ